LSTDVNALRLHAHFDEGSGPAIVMLHGINSDGGDWRTVIDTIGQGYRFVALDLLGFGQSPKPLDIDYTADEHALVIENTLREMGVDEPFLLAGYSLGGDIALRYASTYPDRVRRLFLLDAPFYLPPSELAKRDSGLKYVYERVSQWLWNRLASSKQKDNVLYKLATGVGADQLKEAFHAEDLTTHWDIMSKNLTNTVNAATWVDDLPKLSMPVVHAIGVRDAIVKVSQAPALKRLKPDMEIRRIGGLAADHMVLWNMPERVAEEIMRDEVRELNVAWRGGSGPALVLLHGLEQPSERWVPAAEVLACNNDVAVVDLLGLGDSPAPQSLHYTLADHVAAVMGTVNVLWDSTIPVRFVGEGFGATVALACAATVPGRSAGLVAFSPALLEPGTTLDAVASNERAARAVALRETARRLAEDERGRTATAEKAATRLLALVRSFENAVLATDASELLAQVPAPVLFVVPSEDTLTPKAFLVRVSADRTGFRVASPPGAGTLPYDVPAEAVRAISPDDAEGIALAERAKPVAPRKADNPVVRAAGDLQGALLRTGILNLAAAAIVLLIPTGQDKVLTLGFAIWVAIASVSAIVGAVGMKHKTAGTRFTFTTTALPTLLMGLAGLAVAAFLFADPAAGRRFFGVVVAVYAMARGTADLWVAMQVGTQTTKPRWLLYTGGALGLVTALAIFFGPYHGALLIRLTLAAYLGLTGMSLVAYVVSVKRAAKRKIRELVSS
jgi:cis-3-alkyl-4-acyloxetan-2-one decarboxylase